MNQNLKYFNSIFKVFTLKIQLNSIKFITISVKHTNIVINFLIFSVLKILALREGRTI